MQFAMLVNECFCACTVHTLKALQCGFWDTHVCVFRSANSLHESVGSQSTPGPLEMGPLHHTQVSCYTLHVIKCTVTITVCSLI